MLPSRVKLKAYYIIHATTNHSPAQAYLSLKLSNMSGENRLKTPLWYLLKNSYAAFGPSADGPQEQRSDPRKPPRLNLASPGLRMPKRIMTTCNTRSLTGLILSNRGVGGGESKGRVLVHGSATLPCFWTPVVGFQISFCIVRWGVWLLMVIDVSGHVGYLNFTTTLHFSPLPVERFLSQVGYSQHYCFLLLLVYRPRDG